MSNKLPKAIHPSQNPDKASSRRPRKASCPSHNPTHPMPANGHTRNVFRHTNSTVRNQFEQSRFCLRRLPGGAINRRFDRARRNAVHANFLRREFLRYLHNTAFGRGIIDVARLWNYFAHSAHADDLTCSTRDSRHHTAPQEFMRGLAGAKKLSGQIHADDCIHCCKVIS